uniref:Uncharacterized protein n=1 Tax=Arundo donax TaxID=35708 RepID=A0A0A9HCN5_ARUDO
MPPAQYHKSSRMNQVVVGSHRLWQGWHCKWYNFQLRNVTSNREEHYRIIAQALARVALQTIQFSAHLQCLLPPQLADQSRA